LPQIEATGAHLVAISPMLEKYSRQMVEKHHLGFPLLGDPGNKVAGQFGLVYELPVDLRAVYLKFSLDLPRFNGDDSWTLPLPARYIVGTEGMIRHAAVGTDYTRRPETEVTVQQLKDLAKG
jgi:peroxiredoxin